MADVPSRIQLAVGEQRDFELPGLGTAGYTWDHEASGDDAVDARWTRGWPPGTPPKAVGVSAPETLTIHARRPGVTEVRMYQHRRWEPPAKARAEHRVVVVVTPAGHGGADRPADP